VPSTVDTDKTVSVAVTEELIMSLIGALVGYILTAYILVLIARMVLDWTGVLANGPQWASRARSLTHAWTEPVIGRVRQVLKPVRVGGLSLDLAFTAVFIAVLILRSIAFSL